MSEPSRKSKLQLLQSQLSKRISSTLSSNANSRTTTTDSYDTILSSRSSYGSESTVASCRPVSCGATCGPRIRKSSESYIEEDPAEIPKAPTVPKTGRPQRKLPRDVLHIGQPTDATGDSSSELAVAPSDAVAASQDDEVGKSVSDNPKHLPSAASDAKATCSDDEVPTIARDDLVLFERVGFGSSAEVFRGEWKGQTVAIKKFPLNFGIRSSMVKQQVAFCRETTVAAKVRHNHLVQFYGVAFDKQPYLMIAEFMSGGTVFDLLHGEHPVMLRWKQRLRMCTDVASAMDYLHKFTPQIIHRDLKSLNLLLSQAVTRSRDVPEVKVSDLGVAKMKEEQEEWGMMTAAVGSPHWMAPEVLSGRYSEKVDVYSFAMVLFEIICYQVPLQELRNCEVLKAACSGARPCLNAVPPDCPEKLVELMIRCWTQDPEQRPSFTDIRKTLNAVVFARRSQSCR